MTSHPPHSPSSLDSLASRTELTNEELLQVAIVRESAAERDDDDLRALLERCAVKAEICTDATLLAKAEGFDVLVFDVVDTPPTRLHPLLSTLDEDERTRSPLRAVVAKSSASAEELAPFRGVVIARGESTTSTELERGLLALLEHAHLRRRLEKQQRVDSAERRLVERSLQSVARESSTLSHDARVLFGVILGFAANIRDGLSGPVTDTQRSQLGSIVDASKDAATLVERHVGAVRRAIEEPISRPPSSVPRGAMRRQRSDLGQLVHSTVELFRDLARAKGVALETALDATTSLTVWCDPTQIKQALMNLVANALKFTVDGGHVRVAARQSQPPETGDRLAARRCLEIVVSDDGAGIPESKRVRIFERGYRLPRDSERPGSGLGLAIVRDVVADHGGQVRVVETDGGGATFILTIPTDLRARASDHALRAISPGRLPEIDPSPASERNDNRP